MVVEYDSNQIDAFLQAFPAPVFYLSRQALEDGTNQRVPFNILHTTTGHKVDLIPMRRESWASQQLQRRRRLELFPGIFAWIASPEDTILGKLWYYQLGGSDKHLRDIVGILKIQQHRLDDQFLQQGIEKIGAADIWISIQDKLKESP